MNAETLRAANEIIAATVGMLALAIGLRVGSWMLFWVTRLFFVRK